VADYDCGDAALSPSRLCGESAGMTAADSYGQGPLVYGRKGSGQELARAYRRYQPEIYRFLLRRIRDRDDAEDLCQDVFLDATTRYLRDHDVAALTPPWLYVVARRRYVDAVRHHLLAGRTTAPWPPPPPLQSRTAGVLCAVLADLPWVTRRLLVGRLFEGRSFADLAADIGVSEAACKMRYSRGIRVVRERLLSADVAGDDS
jgi:RNA polymerase sigma-70 factor (ECF subfamily)